MGHAPYARVKVGPRRNTGSGAPMSWAIKATPAENAGASTLLLPAIEAHPFEDAARCGYPKSP
jgi:hypothetical protein